MVDGLEEKISPRAGKKEIERALDKEALRILDLIRKDEFVVLLDSKGKNPTSEALAKYLDSWNLANYKQVNFIIGSAFGLAASIRDRADLSLSLSPLTLPHQMAVMVLSEQLYRAFKILKGEPYHH